MIDWLIDVQIMLSCLLLLLVAAEHYLTKFIGATFAYKLWLLVPLAMILSNIPSQGVGENATGVYRYVVNLKPDISVSNTDLLFLIWLVGFSSILLYILTQSIALSVSIKRNSVAENEQSRPHTYRLLNVSTPFLFGVFQPKIILPVNFNIRLNAQQQQLVLEHERTHYQHLDHAWNLFALFTLALFWFNPLVWLAFRSFRLSQEVACDHQVLLNKTENEKIQYAKALVAYAEHNSLHLNLYPSFGEKSTMLKRIKFIKSSPKANKVLASIVLIGAFIFTLNSALAGSGKAQKDSLEFIPAPPVVRVDPVYPNAAAKDNVEGSVVLMFDITENGSTENIKVVESTPTKVFDKSAMEALKHWKYKPRIQGGVAMRQYGLLVQLDFKLTPETASVK